MSTATTNATTNAQGPIPYRTYYAGKIVVKPKRIKSSNGSPDFYITILAKPAADEFSSPGAVTLRSSQPLGEVGDILKGHGTVDGYRRVIPAGVTTSGEIRPATPVTDMYILVSD